MNTPAKKAAEHWRKEMLEPLLKGRLIIKDRGSVRWYLTGNTLPIYKHLENVTCDSVGKPFYAFVSNPCIKTAQALVDILELVAEKYDEEGNLINGK